MRFKYYLRGAGIGVITATLVLSVAFLFQDSISDEEVIRRAIKLGMVMADGSPGTLADMPDTDADLESGADDGSVLDNDALDGSGDTEADGQPAEPAGDTAADTDDAPGALPDDKTDDDKTDDDKNASDGKTSADEKKPSDNKPSGDEKGSDNKTDNKTSDSKPASDDNKPSENKAPDDGEDSSDEVVITIENGDVSRMVSAKVFEAGLVESADEFNSYMGENGYDGKIQPGPHKIPKGASFSEIAQILTSRQ